MVGAIQQTAAQGPPPWVLLTRPRAQAQEFAATLTARGWHPLLAPMQEIRFAPDPPKLGRATALLFTSQNGVAAFARVSARRDVPALCVGPTTAQAARTAGFTAHEGPGQAAGLAAWAATLTKGPILHVRGRHGTGALAEEFAQIGIGYAAQTLYAQEPLPLSDQARTALFAGTVGAVLLFSPRAAKLLSAALTLPPTPLPPVICLSQAVANAVEIAPTPRLCIAKTPTGAAMIDALGQILPPARAP